MARKPKITATAKLFDATYALCEQRLAWQELNGEQFAALDFDRCVALVSVSPLEVHGPHLPVVTDLLEAEALSLKAVSLLGKSHPELVFVHLPPLYVASDVVPKRGSVKFRPSTVTRVVEDLGRSLAQQGFKHIWVSSFHGGPRHYVPIEVAAHRVSRRYGVSMVSIFSLLINELTGGRSDLADVLGHLPGLDREQLKGDTHAGAIETSLMLHLAQSWVAKDFDRLERWTPDDEAKKVGHAYRDLDHRPSIAELVHGFTFLLKYFESRTYAGDPALGAPQLGEAILEELAQIASRALAGLVEGRRVASDCHSPLWPVRWVFTNEPLSWAFEKFMSYRTEVW